MIKDYLVTEEELELITRSMEVNTNQEAQHYQNHSENNNDILYNTDGDVDGLCMKVMTDEQIEVLRKQISAYATLSQQLAEMHRFFSAQQDLTAGTYAFQSLLNLLTLAHIMWSCRFLFRGFSV